MDNVFAGLLGADAEGKGELSFMFKYLKIIKVYWFVFLAVPLDLWRGGW